MAFNNFPTQVDRIITEIPRTEVRGSSFERIIENDAILYESKWKPLLSIGRGRTFNQLDDPGLTHTAWELDAYTIDETTLSPTVTTDSAMTTWKCFLGGMVYQVPYPIPGLNINETNTTSNPAGTTVATRGGLRVRLFGSNVKVYFVLTHLSGVGTDGNFTTGSVASIQTHSFLIPALLPGDVPDIGFIEEDLLLPKKPDVNISDPPVGIQSGDLVCIWGYFAAGDKLQPLVDKWESLDGIPYCLSGVNIWEYPPATSKIDITRPVGGS